MAQKYFYLRFLLILFTPIGDDLSRTVPGPFFFTSASAPKFQGHLQEKLKKTVVILLALSSFVYIMRVGDISTYMHEIDRKKIIC